MISTFDDPIGYTDPAITERQAITLLHEHYPHATIEPVECAIGGHLFKVFDQPSGIPRRIYVTEGGEPIDMGSNMEALV